MMASSIVRSSAGGCCGRCGLPDARVSLLQWSTSVNSLPSNKRPVTTTAVSVPVATRQYRMLLSKPLFTIASLNLLSGAAIVCSIDSTSAEIWPIEIYASSLSG